MGTPSIPVGFDYSRALLEIRKHMTYEQIAAFCGYEGPSGVAKIINGGIPSHPQGEAIWSLHCIVLGRKPHVSPFQAHGVTDLHLSECGVVSTGP